MARQLKPRRGTTAQNNAFTGAAGEVTVDTTKNTLVVHDGNTAGGHPLLKESASTGFQPVDADLTAIAALTPADDDFIQRKTGVWSNRTVAQVKTDLGIASDISAAVSAHEAAADPHPNYLLRTDAAITYAVLPETWQALSLLNGWTTISGAIGADYRKQGDKVTLRFGLESGTNNLLTTLPIGYRPLAKHIFSAAVYDSGGVAQFGFVSVETTGDITLIHPNPISGHKVWASITFYTT